ncbi:unnamed protein product, partial [Mesorhabditis spiculigera]
MALIKEKFTEMLHFVFPDNCFEELLINYDIFHPVCTKMVLSRVLGLAITAGSVALFIPQILKIAASKSGKGISFLAQLLTLIGAAGTAAYSFDQGFVFSQWGDALFSSIQLVIICMQLLYYEGQSLLAVLFALLWGGFTWAVYQHMVPSTVLAGILSAGTIIVIVAKGLQIHQNCSQGSTGQLAFITVFLQFAGCLARVFTTMQETTDTQLIFQFALATFLNGIIFAQLLVYWNSDIAKKRR